MTEPADKPDQSTTTGTRTGTDTLAPPSASELGTPWTQLIPLLEASDTQGVFDFLKALPPQETARTISRLSVDHQHRLLELLTPADAAEILEGLPFKQAVDLVHELDPHQAASILDQLDSDEQADVLSELEADEAQAVLSEMSPEEAADARSLLAYPDDVAGGVMVKEYVHYPQDWSVREVLDDLHRHRDEYADYDVQYLYVVDEDERLTGVLRIRDLLFSPTNWAIRRVMLPNPLSVRDDTPLGELATLFDQRDWFGVPVTNDGGQLVGVVQQRDLRDALSEQAEEQFRFFSGIVGGEEFRSMPTWIRSGRRLSWLSLNIVLNLIAASVIAFYEDTLAAVIALAIFLPMISDMSGCSGNQAVAVSLRELSLGLVRPHEIMRVVFKEAAVGIINGIVLGILLGLIAAIWKSNGYLGLVVGAALAANTIVAVTFGGMLPLLIKRLNMDPALVASPMLTTVTDMCGFFFVLSIATLVLPYLT